MQSIPEKTGYLSFLLEMLKGLVPRTRRSLANISSKVPQTRTWFLQRWQQQHIASTLICSFKMSSVDIYKNKIGSSVSTGMMANEMCSAIYRLVFQQEVISEGDRQVVNSSNYSFRNDGQGSYLESLHFYLTFF